MTRIIFMLHAMLLARVADARHDERGDAVGWLIVTGAIIGIAVFAGDSIFSYAKQLAAQLGNG